MAGWPIITLSWLRISTHFCASCWSAACFFFGGGDGLISGCEIDFFLGGRSVDVPYHLRTLRVYTRSLSSMEKSVPRSTSSGGGWMWWVFWVGQSALKVCEEGSLSHAHMPQTTPPTVCVRTCTHDLTQTITRPTDRSSLARTDAPPGCHNTHHLFPNTHT